jgi:excisionase family DNA binding protein
MSKVYKTPSIDSVLALYKEGLPPLVTVKKAAEVVSCSVAKLYEMLGNKRFRAVKMDGRTLIDTNSLLSFISSLPEAEITQPKRHRMADLNPPKKLGRPPKQAAQNGQVGERA